MYTGVKAVLALAAGLLTVSAQAQAPSDPQIVGIVIAANQIDIDSRNESFDGSITRMYSPNLAVIPTSSAIPGVMLRS